MVRVIDLSKRVQNLTYVTDCSGQFNKPRYIDTFNVVKLFFTVSFLAHCWYLSYIIFFKRSSNYSRLHARSIIQDLKPQTLVNFGLSRRIEWAGIFNCLYCFIFRRHISSWGYGNDASFLSSFQYAQKIIA